MIRAAKFNDLRRRLEREAGWPNRIQNISWSNLPILGSGSSEVASPFVVFAGPNGSGKSKILNALVKAISPKNHDARELDSFKSGTITVSTFFKGKNIVYSYDFSNSTRTCSEISLETEPPKIYSIEIPNDVLIARNELRELADRDIIINGAAEYHLDTDDLDTVRSLTSKPYDSVIRYITDEGHHYFAVSFQNVHYDSLTMGLGELTALNVWSIIKEAGQDSIIALEEPESFLSPSSRQALSYFLMEKISDRNINFILSTHSHDIAHMAAYKGLVPLSLRAEGLYTCNPYELPEHMEAIGYEYRDERIIYVEDKLAEAFLSTLLTAEFPSVARSVKIVGLNGFGRLVNIARYIPSEVGSIQFFVAPDKDKQGSHDIADIPYDMLFFLPTAGADPETDLKSIIIDNIVEISNIYPFTGIHSYCTQNRFRNQHDFITGFIRKINTTEYDLCRTLYPYWKDKFRDAGTRSMLKAVFDKIYPKG